MIHVGVELSGCIMTLIAFLNTLVQTCIHSYMLVFNNLTVKLAMVNVLEKTCSQNSVYILDC